jgi:hypothetical protein
LPRINAAQLGRAQVAVQSINLRKELFAEEMDARVKPAHD